MPVRLLCIYALVALSIMACGVVDNTDSVATLQADSVLHVTQVAQVQSDEGLLQTTVAQTVVAANTEISEQSEVNNQLLGTVSAGSTPTIAVVNSNIGAQSFVPQNTLDVATAGEQQFVLTGTALEVNPADGCAISVRDTFTSDEDRIYATLRSSNIQQGTLMAVRWSREGTVVWEDSWVVDGNYENLCIWFFLQPSYVEFIPGNWSVQILADGQPIGQPMTFVLESM